MPRCPDVDFGESMCDHGSAVPSSGRPPMFESSLSSVGGASASGIVSADFAE